MRTTNSLLKAQRYLDGKPVYYGDPSRVYSSEVVATLELSIIKAPEGARSYIKADEQLVAAMRKLKFGQIGALKSGINVSSTETICQILIPVTLESVVRVKNSCQTLFNLDAFTSKTTCMIGDKTYTIDQVKDIISKYREQNRDIREKWMVKAKALRSRGASAEDILQQKKVAYAEYVSASDYALAIGVTITHFVHKPSLKATVVDNCDEQTYNLFNYKEGKVRKLATYREPIVSIPISKLADRDAVLAYIKTLITPDKILSVDKGAEQVFIEGSNLNAQNVDWVALRRHDTGI